MKKNLRKHWYGFILAVTIVLELVAGSLSGVQAGDPNPGVFPTKGQAYGMTYAEWSAAYWKWVISLPFYEGDPSDPTPIHAFFDTNHDCSNGARGQHGPVWFLAGEGPSNSVVRDCTVPTAKALFFPIVSFMAADILEETEEELRYRVAYRINTVTAVEAEIDGAPIQNLMQDYHFPSAVFTVGPLPTWNYFGAPVGNTYDAVADGYYLMLAPLSKGLHTIHFAWTEDAGTGVPHTYETTYNLTVAKE